MEHSGLMLFLNMDDALRKFLVGSGRGHLAYLLIVVIRSAGLELSVTVVSPGVLQLPLRMVWLSDAHLRVIDRQLLIEHTNILMAAHGHTVGIQKAGAASFIPYQIVSPELPIALHEVAGKHSLGKEYNCTIGLNNALILRPKWLEWNYSVPLRIRVVFVKHLVWQIADDGINAFVCYPCHQVQAVA